MAAQNVLCAAGLVIEPKVLREAISAAVKALPPKISLTPRQQEALDFIKKHAKQNGASPTFRQMANALNLSSTGPVSRLIDCLVDRGYILRRAGRHRGLKLI